MTDDRPLPLWRAVIYVGAALQGLWIGLPVATQLLIYVMGADILTGLVRAGYQGRINSHCSWKGMMKKASMLIFTGLMIVLDENTQHAWHLGALASSAFMGTEGVSVIENLVAMGVPVPEGVKRFFDNARKQGDGAGVGNEREEAS